MYISIELKENKKEKITIGGMGIAIKNVISTVEILRRRILGLCASYEITSEKTEIRYKALEEGLDDVVSNRYTTKMLATVTLN